MKALVTGGGGFLGSHLVDACLARGDSVRALVRPSSTQLMHTEQIDVCLGDLDSGAGVEPNVPTAPVWRALVTLINTPSHFSHSASFAA